MPCLERLDCKLNLPVLLTKLSNHNQVRKRPWQQDEPAEQADRALQGLLDQRDEQGDLVFADDSINPSKQANE
jgi:hypothetical protein